MRVRFSRDFDFSPPSLNGAATVAYKAGQIYTVPHDHADAAVAAGAGEIIEPQPDKPRRRKPKE